MEFKETTLKKIVGLFEAHNREVGAFPKIALEVNMPALQGAEDQGFLRTYGAYDGDSLVGYNAFLIAPDLYHVSSMAGTEVGIYMIPAFRGHNAKDFIQWVDKELPVDVIYRGTTVARDFGRLLQGVGYRKLSHIYAKEKNASTTGDSLGIISGGDRS